MKFYATCSFGLEALVKQELLDLGAQEVKANDARIDFCGDMALAIRANLWLRCADRVFCNLASFPADSFEALYDHLRSADLSRVLPKDAQNVVTGKTALSKLVSIRDVQAVGKKAIVQSMLARYGGTRCPETGARYGVEIGLLRDQATIGLNLSGAGLNRRGYRDLSAPAPIRETLAAAMVQLARYRGDEILLDPMCGSGTIAIEAALIASHTAPGLQRQFAFDAWPQAATAAALAREEAKDARREQGFAHLMASDIDEDCVRMAHRHSRRAGVHGFINFSRVDARKLVAPAERGVIVTNPPYGRRLAADRQIISALGDFKRVNPQWGVFVISENMSLEKDFGFAANKKRKVYNGSVRCDLYQYFRGRQEKKKSPEGMN